MEESKIMKLAIVGAGAIGVLSAAIAEANGHDVGILSPRGTFPLGDVDGDQLRIKTTGTIERNFVAARIASLHELSDWDAILLAIPGSAYLDVLPSVLAEMNSRQIFIVSGALSLVPLWMRSRLQEMGKSPTIAIWGTTIGTARINADRSLRANTIRKQFELSILPGQTGTQETRDHLVDLFGDKFRLVDNVLVPQLSNINPVAHAGQALPNLSRMERGELWNLFDNFREVGAGIAEQVDAERVSVAKAFGCEVRTLRRHYHLSYHVPEEDIASQARHIVQNGMSPAGPATTAHRYLDEDVQFGLAVYERLGQLARVATPVTSACITVLSAATGKEMRRNPIISELVDGIKTVDGFLDTYIRTTGS